MNPFTYAVFRYMGNQLFRAMLDIEIISVDEGYMHILGSVGGRHLSLEFWPINKMLSIGNHYFWIINIFKKARDGDLDSDSLASDWPYDYEQAVLKVRVNR